MLDQEAFKTAKSQAFKHLSYRDRSKKEIAEHLEKKGHTASIVQAIIQDLENLNYINDDRFASEWSRWRIEVKNIGRKRLRHELIEKGVSTHIIESTLDTLYNFHPEQGLALACANKKLASLHGVEPKKKTRRLAQHLQRRGFSADIIYETLKISTTKDGGK